MAALIFATPEYITDTLIHAPPTTGPYAYSPPYGTFKPDQPGFLAAGTTYSDPVFRSTIRRLTDSGLVVGGGGDIYGKNGWWNADATYFVNTMVDGTVKAINVATGTLKSLTNAGGAQRSDASCSPVNGDEFLYFSTTNLKAQSIASGTITTVKNFGATLGSLGGSQNWIDRTGRYYLVNLGSPSFRVWDRQTDTLFAGAITASFGGGYVAMAPDASYVVHVNSSTKNRHAINTVAQTLASSGTQFYTGGGDHAAIIAPSDDNLYFVRVNNDGSPPFPLERVNVATGAVVNAFTFPNSNGPTGNSSKDTSAPAHLSSVNYGAMRDWVFCSTEYTGGPDIALDNYNASDPVAAWNKMQSEIYMINVLTGAIRRLAHTRSREIGTASDFAARYNLQPRVCVSWDGSKVAWASNYGYESAPVGYSDIYCTTIP